MTNTEKHPDYWNSIKLMVCTSVSNKKCLSYDKGSNRLNTTLSRKDSFTITKKDSTHLRELLSDTSLKYYSFICQINKLGDQCYYFPLANAPIGKTFDNPQIIHSFEIINCTPAKYNMGSYYEIIGLTSPTIGSENTHCTHMYPCILQHQRNRCESIKGYQTNYWVIDYKLPNQKGNIKYIL